MKHRKSGTGISGCQSWPLNIECPSRKSIPAKWINPRDGDELGISDFESVWANDPVCAMTAAVSRSPVEDVRRKVKADSDSLNFRTSRADG